MKKKLIIIIGIILIILMISFFSRPKTKTTTPSPSPTPSAKNQFNLNKLNPQESAQRNQDELDDLKYGQALKNLHQKYPWYSQLPIETKDYRIVYDFDKNSFRIHLLSQASEIIKQAAVDKLKEIGVDLNKFSYYFLEK